MSHGQALIRIIYVYKVTVPIRGSQKSYKFFYIDVTLYI